MSTKRTITSHLNSLKTKKNMTNDVGNQGRSLGQAQKCGDVKLVNAIHLHSPLDNCIVNNNTFLNKR